MFKSATEKHNLKKHLSRTDAACDRKHVNRTLRPKVDISVVVYSNIKVTTKRLDYFVGITNPNYCSTPTME